MKCRNIKCRKTVIFTCFGILKTFRWEYETNKKATDVYIKNNTSVNKSNTIMDEYIYISRSRSFNVEILNVEQHSLLQVLEHYLDG